MKDRDLHSSSLPSILDSYMSSEHAGKTGRVITAVTQKKNLQARKDKEAVQHIRPAADSDEVAEAKQKALLDQRHLEMYHRVHRLRDRLAHHYTELLTEKVNRQREEIKHHDVATLENRAKQVEQRKRKLSIQKFTDSSLKHDDAFLRALPKTRHYLILELQRLLSQHGYLQGPREKEVFQYWVDQHKTPQLEKQLQQLVLFSKSAPELKLEDLLKKASQGLPSIQISNEEEEEKQAAVSENGGGLQVDSPRLHGKQSQEQDHAELKFPSVFSQDLQIPRFSTLQPSFLKMFNTNILLLRVKEPFQKSMAATMTQRKLHLMHSLSLSHMAHTRRLLDKHGLTLQYNSGYSVNDLLDHICLNKIEEQICSEGSSLPALCLREDPQHLLEKPITPSGQVTSAQKSEDSKFSRNEECNPGVPLSMEDIYPPSILLGKDSDNKTWTNYVY